MSRCTRFTLAGLLCLAAAAPTSAAVIITEAMSSSGAGGTADWFEITNTGPLSVSLTGDRMDDNSFLFANSVALSGVASIAVGESVVFLESAGGVDIPAFRTFWGGVGALAGVQVGFYSGSGVSLSSAGDGVIVYDSVGATVAGPVTFPAATTGVSFGYNPNTSTFGGLSVAGQFGAFVSANALGNVGSPGRVPEPSTLVLAAVGGVLCATHTLRRRRARLAA